MLEPGVYGSLYPLNNLAHDPYGQTYTRTLKNKSTKTPCTAKIRCRVIFIFQYLVGAGHSRPARLWGLPFLPLHFGFAAHSSTSRALSSLSLLVQSDQIIVAAVAIDLAGMLACSSCVRGAVSAVHIRFQLVKTACPASAYAYAADASCGSACTKHPQAVVKLLQDIVCIAADDNTALLIRNFPDGPHLGVPPVPRSRGGCRSWNRLWVKPNSWGYALVPAAHLLGCQVGAGLWRSLK